MTQIRGLRSRRKLGRREFRGPGLKVPVETLSEGEWHTLTHKSHVPVTEQWV